MILLCLKTAFSSFSPKICPNALLFNRNYTFRYTHPSEPSVFTILSFKNTAFFWGVKYFYHTPAGKYEAEKRIYLTEIIFYLTEIFFYFTEIIFYLTEI